MDKETDSQKYSLAIIGPYDMVSLFKAFNIDCFGVNSQEKALEKIKELAERPEKNYAVIFVPEQFLKGLDNRTYEKITGMNLPTITSIPLIETDDTSSVEKIRKLAEKAIGSDILK